MQRLSIIIPTSNHEKNISQIVDSIYNSLLLPTIPFQIIIVDDNSTDRTREIVEALALTHPIKFLPKQGKKGKTQSFIEGLGVAEYELVCIVDADFQPPLRIIAEMVQRIADGADVVIASPSRKKVFSPFLNKFLYNLDFDVRPGLKVFRREIIERIELHESKGTVDLQLLVNARNADYKIVDHVVDVSDDKQFNSEKVFSKWISENGKNALISKFSHSDIVPFHPTKRLTHGIGFHYNGKQFIHHSNLHVRETAFHRLSDFQVFTVLLLLTSFAIALLINWHTTLTIFIGVITLLYFADLLFNLFVIVKSFTRSAEIKVTPEEIKAVKDWPSYTVLCPLYKEVHVVPQFVSSMSRLDYPKDKLQVMFVLEEDDTETIEKIKNYNLDSYFTTVVVPHSLPKTKPKACNYALTKATGEYLVIYDAEDVPDPLQLKKAVLAFSKAKPKTVCVQAKLNFYNPHQNILTRVFTAEYSLWFDLVLTGLQAVGAPIPLGGTSNHFKTTDLHKLKGWDSFNVTEDADLGMRLVKHGYTTAIVDSVTLEEANSSLSNWFWQRSRWIKGYMQTYLVHMRDPRRFTNRGLFELVTFQLVIGGKILSMFANPVMWVITVLYFVMRAQVGPFIETFFPTPIFYMGIFSLILGNFLYLYYYLIGCAKHGHDELVKYVFLVPAYWLAMSAAAWVALYKLIKAPHHWSKTKHGLHLASIKTTQAAGILAVQPT